MPADPQIELQKKAKAEMERYKRDERIKAEKQKAEEEAKQEAERKRKEKEAKESAFSKKYLDIIYYSDAEQAAKKIFYNLVDDINKMLSRIDALDCKNIIIRNMKLDITNYTSNDYKAISFTQSGDSNIIEKIYIKGSDYGTGITSSSNHTTIRDVRIDDANIGIVIAGSLGIVTNNKCNSCAKGIVLNGADNNFIDGNYLSNCTTGIELDTSSCENNIIGINHYYNCTNNIVDNGMGTKRYEVDNQHLQIGSENATHKACIYESCEPPDAFEINAYDYQNTGGTDADIVFGIPLEIERGDKSLHIEEIVININAAGQNDYVTGVQLYSTTGYTTASTEYTDDTNRTVAGTYTYIPDPVIDLSGVDRALIRVRCGCTTAGNLKIRSVLVKFYYA